MKRIVTTGLSAVLGALGLAALTALAFASELVWILAALFSR
jgi:hypothetical protein